MATNAVTQERPSRFITDLYDEKVHTFLVQYPIPLVIGLGLSGVAAFMITGFLGYQDHFEPDVTQFLFVKPWPLYLWFCALIVTLQVSILRHPRLRRQLTQTLSVTMFSIAFVAIFDLFGPEILEALQNFLRYLSNTRVVLDTFGKSAWTYSIINFGIIGIYWVDTIRRWARSARGKSAFTPTEIGETRQHDAGVKDEAKKADEPSLEELISGDLIAGAFLTFLLSLFFQPVVINAFGQLLQSAGSEITNCTLALPLACTGRGGGPGNPPTLSFLDLIQSLLYLPLGLLILALTATIAGLGSYQAVQAAQQRGAPAGAATEVGITIFKALQAALTRRVRVAADNFAISLRSVVWPVLILVGTFAVAGTARSIQQYLHLLSAQKTFLNDPKLYAMLTSQEQSGLQEKISQHLQITSPLVALLTGILGVIMIVLSAALLLYQARVAENSLRFLGLVGFVVLLTFWIFSLALSAFNGFFLLVRGPEGFGPLSRIPFPQPGVTTIISFAALVIAGIYLLVRRGRGPRATTRVPSQIASRQEAQ